MRRNREKSGSQLMAIERGNKQGAEQFRTIRTNIKFSSVNRELRTIVITSCHSGDGKTMTAANLAIAFRQEGKKVLLVDADMRSPNIHHTFEMVNSYGLSNFLVSEDMKLENAIQNSYLTGLDIVTSGIIPPNPQELLSSIPMNNFIKQAKEQYDVIIFDTPPVLVVSDATLIANQCDGVLLVVRAKKNEVRDIAKVKEQFQFANAHLIGAILNGKKVPKDHYYYR